MIQENLKWDKIVELIYDYPSETFTVRRISKETKVPISTIQRYLKQLKKQGIINKENKFCYNYYSKFLKAFFMINRLYKIGLVDHLEKELNPSLLVVFGSVRKGEYEKDSDIDLFIETTIEKDLDLKKFEKKLNHKIDLFVQPNLKRLHKNLLSNVLNGIKLSGYLDLE